MKLNLYLEETFLFCCWHLPVHFDHNILAPRTEVSLQMEFRVVPVHHHWQPGKKMWHWERNLNRAAECINVSVNTLNFQHFCASCQALSILTVQFLIYVSLSVSMLSGNAHCCSLSLFLNCVVTENVRKLLFVINAPSPCFFLQRLLACRLN